MSTLAQQRERARRLATGIVSVAIAAAGITLAVFAVFLVLRGGLGFIFLAIILFGLGAVMALLGFFFQLVPLRLQELADQKRENDQRKRDADRERRERGGGL